MELILLPSVLTVVFATIFIVMRTKKKVVPSLVFKTLSGVSFVCTGVMACYLTTFDTYAYLLFPDHDLPSAVFFSMRNNCSGALQTAYTSLIRCTYP